MTAVWSEVNKGRLKKNTSYLVTLSIIALTPTLPRLRVTKCHSDKVVPQNPHPPLRNSDNPDAKGGLVRDISQQLLTHRYPTLMGLGS